MVLLWERAWIIVRPNSFCRVPWLQCLSTPVVRFVDDLRVVEVNNVIKSPRVFCDVWAFSAMLYVPHVFFSPSSKGSFSFANVVPRARFLSKFLSVEDSSSVCRKLIVFLKLFTWERLYLFHNSVFVEELSGSWSLSRKAYMNGLLPFESTIEQTTETMPLALK